MWSVGCILGELSDGQPLFPGESEIDQVGDPRGVMMKHGADGLITILSNKNLTFLDLELFVASPLREVESSSLFQIFLLRGSFFNSAQTE